MKSVITGNNRKVIGLGKGRAIDTPKELQQMILTGAESSNLKKGGRTMPEKLKPYPFCCSKANKEGE